MFNNFDVSTIMIVNDIDNTLKELKQNLPLHSTRVIRNEDTSKDEFLIAHANMAIKEAYIATNQTKYIILCGATFAKLAQNSLLKVLEEPPRNTIFILVSNVKSTFIPTIFSRLRIRYLKTSQKLDEFSLDIKRLDLKKVYEYLKENQRISANDAKKSIESLLYSIHKSNIELSHKELELFSTSIRLLELNSRPINVLTNLMLNILHKIYSKKRH